MRIIPQIRAYCTECKLASEVHFQFTREGVVSNSTGISLEFPALSPGIWMKERRGQLVKFLVCHGTRCKEELRWWGIPRKDAFKFGHFATRWRRQMHYLTQKAHWTSHSMAISDIPSRCGTAGTWEWSRWGSSWCSAMKVAGRERERVRECKHLFLVKKVQSWKN